MTGVSAEPDFAPRYYTIEQALRARIVRLRPHDPLPSETELCKEFKVSRMTARAAVMRLVADGLVYREPGRGTFVAAPSANRRAKSLVRFSEEMRRQGRTPSSELVEQSVRPGTPTELNRLRLGRGADVVAVIRVRLADESPIALEHAVFPATLSALLDSDLAGGSLHGALAALGRVPALGNASLTARTAGPVEAGLLAVEPGSALLVEQRLIYDQDGIPLEITESCYVGGRYALDVAFDVQSPAAAGPEIRSPNTLGRMPRTCG
jgi:GntR family transcriptional regulator